MDSEAADQSRGTPERMLPANSQEASQPVGSSRVLLRDSVLSLTTTAIDAAGAVAVSMLIARLLGTRPTGVFGYAQTLASMLLAVFGLGIPALLAQRVAEGAGTRRPWVPVVSSGLSIFATLSTPGAIVAFLAVWAVTGGKLGSPVIVLAALFSAFGLAIAGMTLGCERARGDFVTPLTVSAVTKGTLIAAILAVAFLGLGLDAYMALAALVQLAVALVLVGRLRRRAGAPVIRRPTSQDVTVLLDAMPFAVLVMLEAISFRVDTLLVEWMRGGMETGWYVAAYTIYSLPILVSYSIASAYYPWRTRARAGKVGVSRASTVTLTLVTLYGVAAAAVCVLLGPWLVRLAFGNEFDGAVLPFRVLALSIPFVAANRLGLAELKGAGHIRGAVVACFVATLVSVIGNVAVLRPYGLAGAAWVNLATEVVTLACVVLLGAWAKRQP